MSSSACWRFLRIHSAVIQAARVTSLVMLGFVGLPAMADADDTNYPAASHTPASQSGWQASKDEVDTDAPPDEAQGGMTERGTPINKRVEECFPAERRDVFKDVDSVPGPEGQPRPFDYLDGGKVSPEARNAIRGKNTWILWGEGNEVFWGWVQEKGYGLDDFLILIDSRARNHRFADAGLINQPGMKAQTDPTKKILGLYIDQADGASITLQQPPTDIDSATNALATRPEPPPDHPFELFTPGDRPLYENTIRSLPSDGVDPTIYGYPTGVVGLRLMPNPDFFGSTPAAQKARDYWKERVIDQGDAYYTDPKINVDPDLVRPFRVSMSCGFCHVGPHPLFPPKDPEAPDWSNLSSTIGDQYWTPAKTFSNLRKPDSFLYQFVASQQPGTIDTSLVSTDHINNSNTIIPIFDLPARLERALLNPPESQSASNLLVPAIEDPQPGANPRHTPRVLLDGADSIGVFGALARVYLNIGAYSEEWKRLHNPVIGFRAQRPFTIATLEKDSVYWRTAERYRIPYLAAFFTYKSKATGDSVTVPMHLSDAPGGKEVLAAESSLASAGRDVFLRNCAVCHSSKQPQGFALTFSRDWAHQQAPKAGGAASLVLPMDFADWQAFTRSPAYQEYVKQIVAFAGSASSGSDPFSKDNYLSTDIRVPITLVGTNSGRAVGTNGMRGQVWDNFSSEDYKSLPAVGEVHFYNPFSGKPVDSWGNNDTYSPPGGGPGYYRPASLVSLWATAPYLHNNALGAYTHDPSVEGRLRAFDDGIDKILWRAKRVPSQFHVPGDLRWDDKELTRGDPGFIYRTTAVSWIDFSSRFLRPLFVGVLGSFWTSFLTLYLWIGLAVVSLLLVFVGRTRHAGFVFALVAVIAAVVLRMSRIDSVYPALWLVPGVATAATLALWLGPQNRLIGRLVFAALGLLFVFASVEATAFVNGEKGGLNIGPVPKGTPVNLIMNLNPEAPMGALLDAAFGMTRGFLRVQKDSLKDGAALKAFEEEAGLQLLKASKCPDFVLDRGHWFAEALTDDEKRQLKAFLRTL